MPPVRDYKKLYGIFRNIIEIKPKLNSMLETINKNDKRFKDLSELDMLEKARLESLKNTKTSIENHYDWIEDCVTRVSDCLNENGKLIVESKLSENEFENISDGNKLYFTKQSVMSNIDLLMDHKLHKDYSVSKIYEIEDQMKGYSKDCQVFEKKYESSINILQAKQLELKKKLNDAEIIIQSAREPFERIETFLAKAR